MAGFFRALSDPECLWLLEFLAEGEHTASECVALTRLAPAKVGAHLDVLRDCGWIRMNGQNSFRLVDPVRLNSCSSPGGLAKGNEGALVQCTHLEKPPPSG